MSAEQQIDKLAKFIQENCPEEITDGGAVDVAIKIINKRLAAIEDMNKTLDVQGCDGNWNYDEYMLGMYNGMELMMAFAERRKPVYKETPQKWGKDNPDKSNLVQAQG